MLKNGLSYFILLLCLILFDTASAQEALKPKPVTVAKPQRGVIEREIAYTGNLEPDALVEIYATAPGTLVILNVDEGDEVNRGDVLAQTDLRELRLALKQAEAGLKAAEAQLLTAKATAQIKIESQAEAARASLDSAQAQFNRAQVLSEAQATSQFEQAQAGVTAAEASLKKAKQGARAQEVQQAQAAVSGAEAGLDQAQANFDRAQQLHQEAAISDKDWDTAQAQLASAKAQHAGAIEQLSLVKAGARQEDILATEAQLHQAEASLSFARITVETEDWETQIRTAQSQVRQAEANLQSAQQLVKIQAWEHDIAAAQAQYDQATVQFNLAEKRLADATITSPINGIVVNRTADIGDYASSASGPGAKPILTVVKADLVKAIFNIPATETGNVAVGTEVSIFAGQQRVAGQISFISPLVNPEDRTVRVKAEIPNPEYRLKPGMFVEIKVNLSASGESLLLPREAVLEVRDRVGHVFIAGDGIVRKQTVKVGLAWGERISVVQGVTESTRVIVGGHRGLTDGASIAVVE